MNNVHTARAHFSNTHIKLPRVSSVRRNGRAPSCEVPGWTILICFAKVIKMERNKGQGGLEGKHGRLIAVDKPDTCKVERGVHGEGRKERRVKEHIVVFAFGARLGC
jgi:hypothetical protein